MSIKKLLIMSLFSVLALNSVSAESVELPFIRGMAESSELKYKKVALSEIRNLIQEGSMTGTKEGEVVSILNYLACEGVVSLRYESLRLDNDYIMVRNEAVRLLGQTGRSDALDTLMTVLQNDTSTLVLSSAVTSCGEIGLTHERMNPLFTRVLKGHKSYYRDDALISDTLRAVRVISAQNGSAFWSSELRSALVDVAVPGSGYGRNTRKLAAEVLGEL